MTLVEELSEKVERASKLLAQVLALAERIDVFTTGGAILPKEPGDVQTYQAPGGAFGASFQDLEEIIKRLETTSIFLAHLASELIPSQDKASPKSLSETLADHLGGSLAEVRR